MHRRGGGSGKLRKEFGCSVNTDALVTDIWLNFFVWGGLQNIWWIIYCGWSLDIYVLLTRGRIIKTLVKLQCWAPCISSYNMKATMCQQCCKSGSSNIIYISSLLGGCMCYYEGHIVASTWLLSTWNSQSENVYKI